jgi:hypothetical protein
MHISQIRSTLQEKFGASFQVIGDECYEVNTAEFKLLFILSAQQSWLRVITPITSVSNATTFLSELLASNFDETLENRYALHQDVLWGVFQHRIESLVVEDFGMAIDRLIAMKKTGINSAFSQFITQRVREIVRVAKQKGDTLEQTMQTLDRFYAEGVMGDLGSSHEVREEMMGAWRYQLTRLWDEETVNPN